MNVVMMSKSDLHPPRSGLSSDPVLYGVAVGLAELFPPILENDATASEREAEDDADLLDRE